MNLAGNHLHSVPAEIGQLLKLAALQLSYNHITSLPPQMEGLPRLTKLSLAKTMMERVPAWVERLPHRLHVELEPVNLGPAWKGPPGDAALKLTLEVPTAAEARRAPVPAQVWDCALVLARLLLSLPRLAAGRRVLELGAGFHGLASHAAGLAGAAEVTKE